MLLIFIITKYLKLFVVFHVPEIQARVCGFKVQYLQLKWINKQGKVLITERKLQD